MAIVPCGQSLVSVVVPAYAVEAYLPACLDSLLAQTWQHLGGDRRRRRLAGPVRRDRRRPTRRATQRIRVVHVPNGGLGSARNVGAGHAVGDFLTFLDSDDVLPPTALSVLVGTLVESGSDFVTGSIVRWERTAC